MAWDAQLYDQEQGFVSRFGKSLLDLVDISPGLRIWDLGCGTGTLSAELAKKGASVIGTDASPEMIAQARKNYPELTFLVGDAATTRFDKPFDLVFSNAVFHWIKNHKPLLASVRAALKPSGQIICEMGAQGNILSIETAFKKSLSRRSKDFESQFFFPSLNEYVPLLDSCGFRVVYIREYDRPTPLAPGPEGLADWIQQFYDATLSPFSEKERGEIIREMENELRPILWQGDRWVADYRRLQFIASPKKENE